MKSIFLFLGITLVIVSCNKKKETKIEEIIVEESVISIPTIEKNRNDVNFELKNGVLFYEEKPYLGIVNLYYDSNKLKSSSQYYNGRKEGFYNGFYENGTIWFKRYYAKGQKVNTHKGWYENGQKLFEYQFNDEGEYNGFVKEWYSNGQLRKHFNFKNGKEKGTQKMWQSSGKIKANFYTVNGNRHGLIGLKNCISVLDTVQINK